MKIQREAQDAMGFLEQVCESPKAKQVLDFAKANGLESAVVYTPDGNQHSAAQFAIQMYANAEHLVNPNNSPVLTSALQIVAILTALEESSHSNWNFGSKLYYKLKTSGINLSRDLYCALLAQEGSWDSNKDKGKQMDGNGSQLARYVATGIYCGRLQALCNTLLNRGKGGLESSGSENKLNELFSCEQPSPAATVELLIRKYAPAYFEAVCGNRCEDKLEKFLEWLRSTDFYTAPCSTKYHLCVPGGLVDHTLNVFYNLAQILRPDTDAQAGELLMAALCHDLCKVNVYKPTTKSKKVVLGDDEPAPAGVQVIQKNGSRFYWVDENGYTFEDSMPFGHGRKSMYIMLGFFGNAISESVACAVDGHMADPEKNPAYMAQMVEQPLCLYLHIADMLASHIDEIDREMADAAPQQT